MDADVILGAVGLTAIVNLSYIMKPVQALGRLFRCPQCMGFWLGGLFYYWSHHTDFRWFDVMSHATIASLAAYTWYLLMRHFIDKYD